MNPEIKAKWVAALRSGKYKQGRGRLKNTNNEYCCLGVLCALKTNNPLELDRSFPNEDVVLWSGIDKPNPMLMYNDEITPVATLNDDKLLSFSKIADLIEAQL